MIKDILDSKDEPAFAWARMRLDKCIAEMGGKGLIKTEKVEARVVWMLPDRVLIGQVREKGSTVGPKWVIAGERSSDFLESTAATSPRDAARRFAMKWQLGAAQLESLLAKGGDGKTSGADMRSACDKLSVEAEELYALTELDELWNKATLPG